MRDAIAISIMAFNLLGICAAGSMVGKPREPLTAGVFTGILITNLTLMVGVYWLWKS